MVLSVTLLGIQHQELDFGLLNHAKKNKNKIKKDTQKLVGIFVKKMWRVKKKKKS